MLTQEAWQRNFANEVLESLLVLCNASWTITRWIKKNGTVCITDLALEILDQQVEQLTTSGKLPKLAHYTFDESNDSLEASDPPIATKVYNTHCRNVVTLKYGEFEAREVVRRRVAGLDSVPLRSTQLARLVPKGCKYGYDAIAHVGLSSFLNGRRLKNIHEELIHRTQSIAVPPSSLDELRRRFLFCLRQLHQHAALRLAEYLRRMGPVTWLIDGTLEPGTPVFFGILEPRSGILLDCRKIPTENSDAIASFLSDAGQTFGVPKRILHDLSGAITEACNVAYPNVPHHVCHFHFARDVGKDLCCKPQKALSSRLRSLKLQVRMREQRKGQTEWLRDHAGTTEASAVLCHLLRGEKVSSSRIQVLGREVLLALHFWILDYAADGSRQGFPFDPHLLYLHRRLVKGQEALVRILANPDVAAQTPRTMFNLRDQIANYLADEQIVTATHNYETAHHIFSQLRDSLRLTTAGPSPMHESYQLTPSEQAEVLQSLEHLRNQLHEKSISSADDFEREACGIVVSHLDKYWTNLMPGRSDNTDSERTTNQLEGYWGNEKRACRHTQGRSKLTQTFEALPSELMLVPNLQNQKYIDLVLDGCLGNLPHKFAEACQQASSYQVWKTQNRPLNTGRLSRTLLRNENFIDDLIDIYDHQRQREANEAA